MDFGRGPEGDLNSIDFSLAAEPVFNKAILKGKRIKDPKVYIGCANGEEPNGWGKFTRPGQRKKTSRIIMYSITIA